MQPFLRYLWIAGRSPRLEWWRIHIACVLAATINDHLLLEPVKPGIPGITFQEGLLIWLCATALLLWISFTSIVRRLHDRGKSGWWSPLYVIPVFGWAWLYIECGFLPGRTRAVAAPSAPMFAPPAAPSASRRAASRAAAPSVGTIQRVEYRPWTRARLMKAAGNAVGLILVALVLYKWFFAPATLPVFKSELQAPAKSNLIE